MLWQKQLPARNHNNGVTKKIIIVIKQQPMSRTLITRTLLMLSLCVSLCKVTAQELNARITINHSQIQGTDASVFEDLEQTLTQFVNDRQWTQYQFQKNERIACNFNITVTKYDNSTNTFDTPRLQLLLHLDDIQQYRQRLQFRIRTVRPVAVQ